MFRCLTFSVGYAIDTGIDYCFKWYQKLNLIIRWKLLMNYGDKISALVWIIAWIINDFVLKFALGFISLGSFQLMNDWIHTVDLSKVLCSEVSSNCGTLTQCWFNSGHRLRQKPNIGSSPHSCWHFACVARQPSSARCRCSRLVEQLVILTRVSLHTIWILTVKLYHY